MFRHRNKFVAISVLSAALVLVVQAFVTQLVA